MKQIKKYIIILLFLIIIYLLFKEKKTNIKNQPKKLIEEYRPHQNIIDSQKTCPITGKKTKITSCIHYPPLNRGIIISTYSKEGMHKIQESFFNADNEYKVIYKGSKYELYHRKKDKQILLECNINNINYILNNIGTTLLN